MKTAFELRCNRARESSEALVKAELGDDALEILCSFANLECVIDVKVADEGPWRRYLLYEGGEDEDADIIVRIS